jgi:tripartite ATP-independent transporter DctM subunit
VSAGRAVSHDLANPAGGVGPIAVAVCEPPGAAQRLEARAGRWPAAPLATACAGICRVAEAASVVILLGACVTMILEVVFRYILNDSLIWSEEVARYALIALTFTGSFVSYHRDDHLAMTLLLDRLGARHRALACSLRDGVIASLAGILLCYGLELCLSVADTYSPVLGISQSWPYAVVPLFGAAVIVQAIAHVARRSDDALNWAAGALSAAIVLGLTYGVQLPPIPTMLVAFVVTVLCGVPVAFALALGGMIGLAASLGAAALVEVPQRMAAGVDSFLLLAIPFFMLTGAIMSTGGFAQKLVDFVELFVGRLRGGLAIADVLVSLIFADISGTAAGDTAAIGSVMIPEMVRRGYTPAYSAGLQAAAGTLGLMFPPATALLIYAFVAQTSVAKLFAAALVPGALVALTFIAIAYGTALRRGHPAGGGRSWRQAGGISGRAILPLFTIVVILGGILGGVFTPTEAGVAAAVYAAVVSLLTRDLRAGQIRRVLLDASVSAARVTFIIAGATLMGWTLTTLQVPTIVMSQLANMSNNPFVILMAINLLLIVVHGLMETVAAILLVVPVVLPLVVRLGVDPVSFGVILIINSAIGLVLPPVGINTYLTTGIIRGRVEAVTREVLPFALGLAIDLLIVTAFPRMALWLPHQLQIP